MENCRDWLVRVAARNIRKYNNIVHRRLVWRSEREVHENVLSRAEQYRLWKITRIMYFPIAEPGNNSHAVNTGCWTFPITSWLCNRRLSRFVPSHLVGCRECIMNNLLTSSNASRLTDYKAKTMDRLKCVDHLLRYTGAMTNWRMTSYYDKTKGLIIVSEISSVHNIRMHSPQFS